MRDPRGVAIAAVLACALGACLDPEVVRCDDGRLCPIGTACDPAHDQCVLPDQLTTCGDDPDGTACPIAGETDVGICHLGVCVGPRCGDGVATGFEACDGADFGDAVDCTSLGFYDEGTLACADDCTLDTGGCAHICGDGVRDPDDEECDELDLGDLIDCTDLGFYDAAPLSCNSLCRFDVGTCTGFCGDGDLNGTEQCDGADLGDVTGCQDLGFYDPGAVGCLGNCRFDNAACTGTCGDGDIEPDEEACDGVPPPGATCLDYGFDAGAIECSELCSPDFATCRELGWKRFNGLSPGFRSVWGAGDTVMAGGSSGTIVRWDGSAWIATTTGLAGDVVGLWGPAGDDLFAVTDFGEIARWNGAAWTTMSVPGSDDLTAVAGISATDVWATRRGGDILHWNGASWTVATHINSQLFGVWAIAADDVWAVGGDGAWHWNGAAWVSVPALAGIRLVAVWASASDDILVGSDDGGLLRGDGVIFTPVRRASRAGIYSIHGSGADDIMVSGTEGMLARWDGEVWTTFVVPTDDDMEGIWTDGSGRAFAAAVEMWRYEGDGWAYVAPVVPAHLSAIGGRSATEVFAVGELGTTLRFDGFRWRLEPAPTGLDLVAVSDRVAVGDYGTIVRWNGSVWTKEVSPTPYSLRGVWSASPTDAWAVGVIGAAIHWNGTAWSTVATGTSSSFRAVHGCATDDVWAVGDSGTVAHWNGVAWTVSNLGATNFFGVWCAASNDVWAVGSSGRSYRWNGSTWTALPIPGTAWMYSVTVTASGEVVVATGGGLLTWTGSNYAPMSPAPAISIDRVWAAGDQVFGAGTRLGVARRESSAWTTEILAAPAQATIWAGGPADVHAIAATEVHGFDGAIWSRIDVGSARFWTAVWGTNANDVHIAADDGTIIHWDGATWSETRASGGNLYDLRGTSATDVWAVGSYGLILHQTGAGWSQVPAATGNHLYAVWPSATDDVWAFGPENSHFDGTTWSSATVPLSPSAAWGSGGMVIGVGGAQVVIWDGASWSPSPSGVSGALYGVWGAGPDDVFAGGQSLIHWDGVRWTPVEPPQAGAGAVLGGAGSSVFVGGYRLHRYRDW